MGFELKGNVKKDYESVVEHLLSQWHMSAIKNPLVPCFFFFPLDIYFP